MSRRPIAANPVQRRNDVRRRMWSESPVPKVASRRVRSVGGKPLMQGQEGLEFTTSGATTGTFSSSGIGVGDVIVAVAAGFGTWDTTGWTTLHSGTTGSIGWWLGWRRLVGSDSLTITRATATGLAVAQSWRFTRTGGLSVSAPTPQTGTSVSSLTMPLPRGTAQQFVIVTPPWTDTANWAQWPYRQDYTDPSSASHVWNRGTVSGGLWNGSFTLDDVWIWISNTLPLGESARWWTTTARTTPQSVTSAVCGSFGWAA